MLGRRWAVRGPASALAYRERKNSRHLPSNFQNASFLANTDAQFARTLRHANAPLCNFAKKPMIPPRLASSDVDRGGAEAVSG